MAPVDVALGLELHSDVLPNLHHVLYASAWERRRAAGFKGRRNASPLPAQLEAASEAADAAVWDDAIAFYDTALASEDLLFGENMKLIGMAIATGNLRDPVIPAELRDRLTVALPVYQRHHWPAHDAANRAWITAVQGLVRRIGAIVVHRLETLLMAGWPTAPVRVDVVWVGSWAGGYTSTEPSHITLSSTDPRGIGTASVEILFHEAAHLMTDHLQRSLDGTGDLWHVVQFYLVGTVVKDALRDVGIDYEPYLDATGLLDRAWPTYRTVLETHWQRYADGKAGFDATVAATTDELR